MSVSSHDQSVVEGLLGREPRGLEAIAFKSFEGEPMVIRVSPLVDGKPFPTLFWLVDKRLNYAIDQVEAMGLIAQFQQQVDADQSFQASMADDHQQYIQLRQQFIPETVKQEIERLGFTDVLSTRGIGGIADFQRIRCLHTYYAAHLVKPNTVGRMLEAHWREQGVGFEHFAFHD